MWEFLTFSLKTFRHHALVIWKQQTKIHQHAQQMNVDIL